MVTAAVIAPVLSVMTSLIARAIFLRRTPDRARAQLTGIEATVNRVADLRRAGAATQPQMEEVLKQIVEGAWSIERGERLLGELKRVRVEGGTESTEMLITSAEQSLRDRFPGTTPPEATPS